MTFANDVLALAKNHVGEKYVLGARAKFLDPAFRGPWDCAEFVSWVIFRASGEAMLLGCRPSNPEKGDAYTGYWAEDAVKYGLVESVKTAMSRKGYLLIRRPTKNKIGHIAFSCGDGIRTIEAHSSKLGVIVGKVDVGSRGWHMGIRLPTPSQWRVAVTEKSKRSAWSFQSMFDPVRDPRLVPIAAALKRAGYKVAADADRYTEAFAAQVTKFQARAGIVVDGVVGPQTIDALKVKWTGKAAPSGTYNDKYQVYFDSLVSGGFYSFDPDDLGVRRSIRTNNPGALNIRPWQKSLRGYVGVTPPDHSPQRNRTTIYRTPEHGVAAWYVLLAERYGFSKAGSFTLQTLAQRYAGSRASAAAVAAYTRGWARASNGALTAETVIHLGKTSEMLALARAMFFHEIGKPSPLSDSQIRYGIETQRAGAMPA